MHFKSRHRQVWSQVWLLNILKLKSQQRLVASNLQRSKHFCIILSCAISHKGSRKKNGSTLAKIILRCPKYSKYLVLVLGLDRFALESRVSVDL